MNDSQKKLALLEQERDFLKNDLAHAKDGLNRNQMDTSEISKQAREKEDKMKRLRQKKKQLEKDLTEAKAQKDKAES